MKRIAGGKVRYYLADTLRKHVTYTYHLLTIKRPKVVIEQEDFIKMGDKIAEEIDRKGAPVSLRILDRALQIASSSSLVSYLAKEETNEIWVDRESIKLAQEFVMQEIETRALKA